MGTRSDICAIFYIENIEKFKTDFKAYLLKIMDNNNYNNIHYMLDNYYQIIEITNSNKIGFCYFDECISFNMIKDELNNFFDFLELLNIEFEAKELCTEYLELDKFNYSRKSESKYSELFINCILDGTPETTDINLLNWVVT